MPGLEPARAARPDAGEAASYEGDFHAWAVRQARLFAERRFEELDHANLAEEIEDMARSDPKEIESRLLVLVTHLLKWHHQPDGRCGSWRSSIVEARVRINRLVAKHPSLRGHPAAALAEAHQDARVIAAGETRLALGSFPEAAPFTIEQALDPAWLPDPAP